MLLETPVGSYRVSDPIPPPPRDLDPRPPRLTAEVPVDGVAIFASDDPASVGVGEDRVVERWQKRGGTGVSGSGSGPSSMSRSSWLSSSAKTRSCSPSRPRRRGAG